MPLFSFCPPGFSHVGLQTRYSRPIGKPKPDLIYPRGIEVQEETNSTYLYSTGDAQRQQPKRL